MSISQLTCAGLEEALNQYITMDPKAAARLAKLHGRAIALEIAGAEIKLFLIPGPGRLQLLRHYEGEPECTLRGSPLALTALGMAQEKEVDKLLSNQITITGDVELGRHFGQILGALKIDWEEQLAVHLGDFVAHDIVSGVRFITDQGRRTAGTIGQSLAHYIQTEAKLLPERQEIQDFITRIDTLRNDFEHLQARIDRLRNPTTPNHNEH
ncbi:MAG: SCP2 sterol-binding domain-containing protein [Candidatus Polarisedimenticolaceae bacterium]|nr:SCP2 sterol-binding domain-containing protein [Candidatus Polarisedimenticolaceae bacterium]